MYRLLDHTADVQIEALADTREHALAEAARALCQVITGQPIGHEHRPEAEMAFALEAPDLGALAVAFLSELLWILESEDRLWVGGGVTLETQSEGLRLRAQGNAVRYDPARHGRGVEVKAVTYHALEFVPVEGQGWRLKVILDL